MFYDDFYASDTGGLRAWSINIHYNCVICVAPSGRLINGTAYTGMSNALSNALHPSRRYA